MEHHGSEDPIPGSRRRAGFPKAPHWRAATTLLLAGVPFLVSSRGGLLDYNVNLFYTSDALPLTIRASTEYFLQAAVAAGVVAGILAALYTSSPRNALI